jgi:hypothetical protein
MCKRIVTIARHLPWMASTASIQTEDGAPASAMPTALGRAVAVARGKLTGLVVVSAPDDETASILRQDGLAEAGRLTDRDVIGDAIALSDEGMALGTVPTCDAVEAIVALRRLAADRFALAASLRLVVAERRVEALCENCREPMQAFGSTAALLGLDPGAILWEAPGCERCGMTGRSGEVPVFEVVEVDSALRRLIYDGADAPLLARHAFLGAHNFAAAARAMARDGLIAPETAIAISRG